MRYPPPPKNGEGRDHHSPANTQEIHNHTDSSECIAGYRRRREASRRVQPYRDVCACTDPWTCRCDEGGLSSGWWTPTLPRLRPPRARTTPAAFEPEMRALWRQGSKSKRLVRTVASAWEMAAA